MARIRKADLVDALKEQQRKHAEYVKQFDVFMERNQRLIESLRGQLVTAHQEIVSLQKATRKANRVARQQREKTESHATSWSRVSTLEPHLL